MFAVECVTALVRVSQKLTIEAQSCVEILTIINRVQLSEQECLIQVPILGEEPCLSVLTA